MSAKYTFDAALAALKGKARPSQASLQGLSALGPTQVASLHGAWPTLPPERRRWVVGTAAEMAEDNFELDFTALFRLALADPDAEVRRAAVEGLWESEDEAVAEELLRLLATDPSAEVRAAAASALGQFTYLAEMEEIPAELVQRTRAALLAAIRSDQPLEVRRRAVEAVGFLGGDEEVQQVIAQAYAEQQPSMRTSAVFAMGRNCDPRWLADVLHEMESPSAEMRFEAARAAGEIADPRALPRLLRLLGDPDEEVRLSAIQALGEVGGEQAVSALRVLLQSEDQAVVEAAEAALAEAEFAEAPLSFGLEDELRPHDHEHGHDHPHEH